ncbi:hypothetical protein DENSPDRAFT_881980 [Dentipellis sp. KUC8613]|nr:hypothetical protein DENSPDRAFT_881980 [Dentipellis sp. KUC8613]
MLRQLLLVISVLSIPLAHANVDNAHGVTPEVQRLFSEPDSVQTWTCLDGSKEIPLKAVNNGHCDCPDGTDEPATGACLDTTQECCDGSDGRSEVCSTKCIKSGETIGKNQEAETNIRKKGYEIRSKYIASAQEFKNVLKRMIADWRSMIAARDKEASRLKHIITIMESTEELLAAVLGERHYSFSMFYDSIAKPPSEDAALGRAREALKEAEGYVNFTRESIGHQESLLDDLFNTTKYGKEGEWVDQRYSRLTKDIGDHTYEVFLFHEVTQMSNNGGEMLSLGKFSSWNPAPNVTEGSSEYYKEQLYTNGTQCWNGVHRSVQLKFECGLENAILSVEEPEECKYLFTGTSPAVCFALEEGETGKSL